MAINFYADASLTLPIGQLTPKRFLFPPSGGTKTSQIWLGDPYTATVTALANPGDTELNLDQTSEFLAIGGTVTIDNQILTYTGKSQSQLLGVSGITSIINITDEITPSFIYLVPGGGNLEMFQIGADSIFGVQVAFANAPGAFGFPGMPVIFNTMQVGMGEENAIELFVGVSIPAGLDREFTNWGIQCNNLYLRDVNDSTAFSNTEGTYAPTASGYLYRHDQSLPVKERLFPTNRRVSTNSPGFIIGSYRWRDASTRNATALLPTQWDIDPVKIGLEKFVAGIGDRDDLEPVSLTEVDDSIFMNVEKGSYFTGALGYYLPADPVLEFLPCNSANGTGSITLPLQKLPREQSPIFVGTYALDSSGFYDKNLEYEYIGSLLNPDNTLRTDLPANYFTVDRRNQEITLSGPLGEQSLFVGLVSGQSIDYCDLPIYPVDNILRIYIDRGLASTPIPIPSFNYDREQGTIQVPFQPGSLVGQPIYAVCSPAVAVLYDTGPDDTQLITTVDFNPAFSGMANGFLYLQHSRQKPTALVLSCDKPRIIVPASLATIIGLVAFGPVYFKDDYALLSVTAFSSVAGQVVPNAKLDIVVDPTTFSGTINYQDPTTTTVSVITGGDGIANFIFIPAAGFGVWLPTTNAAGIITSNSLGGVATTTLTHDTLVLPTPVPISELWNPQDGWLVNTYTVIDDDPLLGMVGADPTLGEVPWITTGTPGGVDYKTNGERNLLTIGGISGNVILPIDALDINGISYTHNGFLGTVKKLVYPSTLPAGANIGAYFISFLQQVQIQVQLENSNIISNTILLEMAIPDVIVENPWLIINDQFQGLINQYRLGWSKPIVTGV